MEEGGQNMSLVKNNTLESANALNNIFFFCAKSMLICQVTDVMKRVKIY